MDPENMSEKCVSTTATNRQHYFELVLVRPKTGVSSLGRRQPLLLRSCNLFRPLGVLWKRLEGNEHVDVNQFLCS